MVHMYIGILPSHYKEWNNAICSNMNGLGDYHTKWNKSKTNFIRYCLCAESKKIYNTNELIYETETGSQT